MVTTPLEKRLVAKNGKTVLMKNREKGWACDLDDRG